MGDNYQMGRARLRLLGDARLLDHSNRSIFPRVGILLDQYIYGQQRITSHWMEAISLLFGTSRDGGSGWNDLSD